MQHGANIISRQFLAAFKEIQFNYESQSRYFSAEIFHQFRDRRGGAAGGEHIVDDQHMLTAPDGVDMHFQRVGSVFELVLDPLDRGGKFFGFADRYESGVQRVGDSGRENKSARFDAHHFVDSPPRKLRSQRVNQQVQSLRVLEQGGDVVKQDTGLGKIRYFPDERFQMIHVLEETILSSNVRGPTTAGPTCMTGRPRSGIVKEAAGRSRERTNGHTTHTGTRAETSGRRQRRSLRVPGGGAK